MEALVPGADTYLPEAGKSLTPNFENNDLNFSVIN